MTIVILLLASVSLIVPISTYGAETGKAIDPFLLISRSSSTGRGREPLTVLITSSGPLSSSQRATLSSFGAITSSIRRVTVLRIDSDNLKELTKLEFVSGASMPRSFRPTLDVSVPGIGATYVWENVRDVRGSFVDGSGVLIGIVDTGVDLSHPDLSFANGTSKVMYLWDQTESGNPPKGFTYGTECSWTEINMGKCLERDTFGHGTHVASIAASSGLASGMYQGVAPGAALLVVKSGKPLCNGQSWTFDENTLLDGLSYLVQKAQALRMRLVVNLSIGGNLGGHDDTSPLELALDDLATEGVVATVSAGNEAENRGYATGYLRAHASPRIEWEMRDRSNSSWIDLWYPIGREISTTIVTPSGERVQGPTSTDGTNTSDGRVFIVAGQTTKGKEWAITVTNEGTLQTSGWSLILHLVDGGPAVRWDAWVDGDSCAYPPATFAGGEGYTIDSDGTVSVPGTASGVISVGAYVTKNSWMNRLGKNVTAGDSHLGQIASFSSHGPTRDGRTKPEIAAPGMFIAAARSTAIRHITRVPMGENDPDEYHRVLSGTSMAAPHVAGVVALMLQYAPSMTPDQVRSVLIQGTSLDAFTGLIEPSHGSNEWGWGKLDARTATVLFRVSSAVMLIPAPSAVNLTLDREAHVSLAEGEVLTMRFQKGTVHTIELTEQTFTTNMTRYLVPYTKAVFSGNSIFTPDIRTQYLLSLESPIGEVEGGGWYDAGSHAGFSVQPLSVSGRVSGFLGLSYVFDHWIDERGNDLSSGVILMGSPHSLTAEWRLEVTDWKPAALLGILVAALLLLAVRRKRKTRKKESEPYQ